MFQHYFSTFTFIPLPDSIATLIRFLVLGIRPNLQFRICKDQGLWQIQPEYPFSSFWIELVSLLVQSKYEALFIMEKEISYMIHSTACMGQTGHLAGGVWEFRNTKRKLWTFYGYLMFSHYIGLEMLKRVFSSVSSRSRRIGSSKFSYMQETFPNRMERFRKQLWALLFFSFKNWFCNISQITPRPLFQLHMLRVPFGISQVCRIFRSVT